MLTIKKAFTLIELLVVIGVLAVIMAGVVALINPQDKIRQANDAKIQSDIGQIATALQSAAAQSPTGIYPLTLAALATTGELVTVPNMPSGGAYGYTGGGTTAVVVSAALTSLKYISNVNTDTWVWCSSTGRAGAVANATTCP